MEKHKISESVTAFVHPGGRSSCGMIHTTQGTVLIDTTARPVDIQECLDLADADADDICQILLTHSHSDHTSGIPLFDCPVLSHKLTRQRIRKRGTERSKAQVPTHIFEERINLDIGGIHIEMIHVGGHTPGSSIIFFAVFIFLMLVVHLVYRAKTKQYTQYLQFFSLNNTVKRFDI